MGVILDSKKIFLFLSAVAILLVATSLFVSILAYGYHRWHPTLYYLFDVDTEANIPSYFSSFDLLFAATILLALGLIRRIERSKDSKYWLGLALIFLYLSVDENISIHELIIKIFWRFHAPSDFDNFVWLIPYGTFVLVLAVVYFRFILSLPPRTRLLFALSGVLFVSGALGMEAVGGLYIGVSWYQPIEWEKYGDLTYYLIANLEECLEMFGVIVFIYALLSYAERTWDGLYMYAGKAADKPRKTMT
ncbi:MAG: hypothetical protein K9G33_01750 [Sneathiella sp.]|nr:hypothetical protein [Sneathiella sp.]